MKTRLIFMALILVHGRSVAWYHSKGKIEDENEFEDFDGNLQHSSCGGIGTSAIDLQQLEVTPKRFVIPQNITMSLAFSVLRDIEPPLIVNIGILKELGILGYVKLPCIANYGSCSFKRICEILETNSEDSFAFRAACPKWMRAAGIKCKCPIEKGHYGAADVVVHLGESIVPKWLAAGNYKAELLIEDKNQTVGCFKFQFRLS